MKFFHVTSLYKITGSDGNHSTSRGSDIHPIYSQMLEESSISAKKHVKEDNYERIIFTGEVQHVQDIFRSSLKKLVALWTENYPCNILYTGPDVLFLKDVSFTDKFDKFMMFNYTDPKNGFGYPHYFNADVKYYPSTMSRELWDIALEMEKNWPNYEFWDYEQTIWNKMFWGQNFSIHDVLKPEYAYQLVSTDLNFANTFNGIDISTAKIVHCMNTRDFYNKLAFMKFLSSTYDKE